VAGERVADSLGDAVARLDQEKPLESESGSGAIADEVFEALEIPRHVAIREGDADA
jgi:hypothetical protein